MSVRMSWILLVAFLVFSQQASGQDIFEDSGQALGSGGSIGLALGDVDGDGDVDAFVANGFNTSNQSNRVWFNDGAGSFIDSGQDLGGGTSRKIDMADLDGDGDLDVMVANIQNQGNRVWLNDGMGFYSPGQALGSSATVRVAFGDLDGDGDLDAFAANNGQPDRVWLNDATGGFVDSGQQIGNTGSHDVALGDLDGDGDLDAFVANHGANQIWLNDRGTFLAGQTMGSSRSRGIALGDLDGDGDLDGFVTNQADQADTVWRNDGSARFTRTSQDLDIGSGIDADLGDLDGDGDLDAVVANLGDNTVWLNDGLAGFVQAAQVFDAGNSFEIALGDLDGDLDLDVFVANWSAEPNTVWLNRLDSQSPPTGARHSVTLPLRSAGVLTVACQGVVFPETSLAGEDVLAQAGEAAWTVTDSTNLGAGWHVTVSAADHLRGDLDPEAHVIRVGLGEEFTVGCLDSEIVTVSGDAIRPPSCPAGDQSIPLATAGESPLTILSAAANEGMGAYEFLPRFEIVVPGTTAIDLYSTLLFVDIVAGP